MQAVTHDDFAEVLRLGLKGAREALSQTPMQIEVLARNHVVDAGGQGFVYFLEGALEAPHGDAQATHRESAMAHSRDVPRHVVVHAEAGSEYRYCAEVPIAAEGASGRDAAAALVADSTCDLPETRAHELGLVTVPLTISFGDESFLDGIDMSPTASCAACRHRRRCPARRSRLLPICARPTSVFWSTARPSFRCTSRVRCRAPFKQPRRLRRRSTPSACVSSTLIRSRSERDC